MPLRLAASQAIPTAASNCTRPAPTATRSTRTTSARAIAASAAAAARSPPDYSYSDALKSSNIVWNEETLDKWLTDPQAFVPGVRMFFHLDSPQDRADVIAYLKERAK